MKNKHYLLSTLLLLVVVFFTLHATSQVLHSVYFESASSALDNTQETALDQWLENYLPVRSSPIELKAYCDERSGYDYNMKLSESRGREIENVLKRLGYTSVKVIPFGKVKCDVISDDCLRHQRRVDIALSTNSDEFDFRRIFDQKPFQKFVIDHNQNTIIHAAEGTEIHFAKGCFNLNKEEFLKPVEIYLREYHKLGEMVLAGLTTASGDQMIESGGSLEIYAVSQESGRELSLLQPMGLIFPGRSEDDRMLDFFSAGYASNDYKLVYWENSTELGNYLFSESQFYADAEASKRAKEIAKTSFDAYPIIEDVEGPMMFSDGEYIKMDMSAVPCEFKGKSFALYVQRRIMYRYKEPVVEGVNRAQVLNSTNNDVTKIKSETTQEKTSKLPEDKRIYIPSKNFGFINCDRWMNSSLPLANAILKEPEPDTYYALLFRDIHSVMPVYNLSEGKGFPNIPIHKRAVLIAIKYKDDQYYFGMNEVVCDESKIEVNIEVADKESIQQKILSVM